MTRSSNEQVLAVSTSGASRAWLTGWPLGLAAVGALLALATSEVRGGAAGGPCAAAERGSGQCAVDAQGREVASEPGQYRLYTVTDRPLYRPGEAVWFRTWELSTGSLVQLRGEHGVTFELVDPRGAVVAKKRVKAISGVAANDFVLPATLPGGRYSVTVSSDLGGRDQREIVVASYELPRLKKQIAFRRSSYSPGDTVVADVALRGPDGSAVKSALVTGTVWIDGAQMQRVSDRSNRLGMATLRFDLPRRIARGDGLLTISVDDGGATEISQRRIPIAVEEIEVGIFPEGGDLVEGIESRVFVAARTPLGQAADVTASVIDDRGRVAAKVRTKVRGMGHFSLVPQRGRSYSLRLVGRKMAPVPVPAAVRDGCVMSSEDAIRGRDIAVRVTCTEEREVTAVASLRGRELGRRTARTESGATLRISVPPGAQGAAVVTVLDEGGLPLAERLVYRGLDENLVVEVEADRESYTPRDTVELVVRTTDSHGRAVSADLAVAVVDEALLSHADDRSGHILARLYLEPEMPGQHIEDPNFFFSGEPGAEEALEHLLATRGWRRFRRVRSVSAAGADRAP